MLRAKTAVDQSAFRMRSEGGLMQTPLLGASYGVWALAGRRITEVRARKRPTVERVGPNARRDATNFVGDATEIPPAIRISYLHGAINFPPPSDQVGVLASMNTDALPGLPALPSRRRALR